MPIPAFSKSLNTVKCRFVERVFYMADSTRNLSPNTVAFSCLEIEVALTPSDVIAALVSVLRWRQVSQNLLTAILIRIAEAEFYEITHAEFSAALWPNLKDSAREEKLCKQLQKFKEDMVLSNCFPVKIPPPRRSRRTDGSFKMFPTQYLPGIFPDLFRAVQNEALNCDLFSLEKDKRRATVRVIVKEYLLKIQARPIEKYKKKDEIKPPAPFLPCRCACPSCVTCAAKPQVETPARDNRVSKETVELKITAALEILFDAGQDWQNLNLKTNDFTRKVWAACEQNELRLLEAMKRHNAPSLKLVGDQAK